MTDNSHDQKLQASADAFQSPTEQWWGKALKILKYLTYIEQVTGEDGVERYFRRRLTPNERAVYQTIRDRAGEDGVCFAGGALLAAESAVSNKTLTRAKKVLQMSFEQLGGSALIELEEKYIYRNRADGSHMNKVPQHIIKPTNIWSWNNAYAKLKPATFPLRKQELTKQEAEMAIERMGQVSVNEVVHNPALEYKITLSPPEGLAQIYPVQRTNEKEPSVKEKAGAALQACFLMNDLVSDGFSCESKAFDWLTAFGFASSTAEALLEKHPITSLQATAHYVAKQHAKKPITKSLPGYFMATVKKGFWKTA